MIRIRVPATTANVGAGFDSVGIALSLYNELEIYPSDKPLEIIKHVQGDIEIADTPNVILTDTSNLIYKTIANFFDEIGKKVPNMRMVQKDSIPLTRGLGSSAACIVAGLLAANELSETNYSKEDLLQMAAKIEGHPDNVAPAMLGGIVVGAMDDETLKYVRTAVSNDIAFVSAVPNFPLSTEHAREILPETLPLREVVFSVSRAALLVASFMANNWENLDLATEDLIHQPYRKQVIPNMEAIMCYMKLCGAKGTFLSGAGPTIISVVKREDVECFTKRINNYLQSAETLNNLWNIHIYWADNTGAQIFNR